MDSKVNSKLSEGTGYVRSASTSGAIASQPYKTSMIGLRISAGNAAFLALAFEWPTPLYVN